MRLARIDRGVCRLDFVARSPAPGVAAASWTPEGYLRVDAFTARDGLLQYSDGKDTWMEYRPRESLTAAAPSFTGVPVTDDHPEDMVSAASWLEVARGHSVGEPKVVELDGVGYLHDTLLITAEPLLAKIRPADGVRELSIGFLSEVIPASGGVAPDGTKCDAIQTAIAGNHVALVARGRAGPACRLHLDSAAWSVWYDRSVVDPGPLELDAMKNQKPKTDAEAAPAEMVEIPAPDGSMVMVPTWIAAMVAELEQLRGQAGAVPAAPVDAQVPVAPAAAPVAAPAPIAAPVAAPQRDAVEARVRRRAALERQAVRAGIADAAIDAADDDTLAREVVAVRMPWAKDDAAKLRGDALDALVLIAGKVPAQRDVEPTVPWGTVTKITDSADDEAELLYLERLGY